MSNQQIRDNIWPIRHLEWHNNIRAQAFHQTAVSLQIPDKPYSVFFKIRTVVLSENDWQKAPKMPSKHHQKWPLRKIFCRRTQITEFCACKYKSLFVRRLSPFFRICAISERRKAAFSGQNVRIRSAVRASRGYDGAVVVLQRRPCCNAVRAPLQPREALTAEQASPGCASDASQPF